MTNAALSPDPIADLWREAHAWLAAALRDFRGAAEIARTLVHEARAAIRRRLMLLESLVMKLLLIEAARLPPVPPASSSPGRSRSGFASAKPGRQANSCTAAENQSKAAGWKPAIRLEDPARPETWRVRFHLRNASDPQRKRAAIPFHARCMARLRAAAHQEAAVARDQAKAIRLARRFESLRRVLADPRRAIKRLALRLRGLGNAARAVARCIALAHPPRAQRLGAALASAIVHGYDASFSFPGDTS
jgi:hypothetical protein